MMHVSAQNDMIIEIPLEELGELKQQINNPEFAKNLLLFSNIELTDSSMLCEFNCFINEYEGYGYCRYLYDNAHKLEQVFLYYDSNYTENGVLWTKWGLRTEFTNGYAIVSDAKEALEEEYYLAMLNANNYALINKQGKITIPFKKYDKIYWGVYEGLVPVCKNNKWGFASPDGTIKIKLQYEETRFFSEGLAAVKKNGKWGYIDNKGNVVIPFTYDAAYEFIHGVAVVKRKIKKMSEDDECGFMCGLINNEGISTFDLFDNPQIKEYQMKEYHGRYKKESGKEGDVHYSYYEDSNGYRKQHGYFLFESPYYREDGHYNDGEKFGRWVYEWLNKEYINYYPFFHFFNDEESGKKTIIIDYVNDTSIYYNYLQQNPRIEISGDAYNGIPIESIFLSFIGLEYIPLDTLGNVSGDVYLEVDKRLSTRMIPMNLILTFYKGVPLKVVEYNESTGETKIVFKYEGFTSVDDITEIIASNGKHLYKIGDNYYYIEPKDPRNSYDIVDIYKYPDVISEPLSFLLNLPASWPVSDIKSPQLNYFRKATWDNLKDIFYDKYGKYFKNKSEFDDAYSKGEKLFLRTIDSKKMEIKQRKYNQYQHLFCSKDEFDSFYGDENPAFDMEILKRDSIYKDYYKNQEWFTNFCEYYSLYSSGEPVEEKIIERKLAFDKNKNYFINQRDFLTYYIKGIDTLSNEIIKRKELFENSKDPFSDIPLFVDLSEFLRYYTDGTILYEVSKRKQTNKNKIREQYGQLFKDDDDFWLFYEIGQSKFLQEAAFRKFQLKVEDFSELKLKEALSSKKEDIIQYLNYVNECTTISQDAYPRIVKLIVTTNNKMSKEWMSNGLLFENEVEFYEAYISDNYKKILKSKRQATKP